MTMLPADLNAANAILDEAFAVYAVTIRRGAASGSGRAGVAESAYLLSDDRAVTTRFERLTFSFAKAEYRLAGEMEKPRVGDRIELTLGGEFCLFECMQPGGGVDAVETDPDRLRWHVHTKRVA